MTVNINVRQLMFEWSAAYDDRLTVAKLSEYTGIGVGPLQRLVSKSKSSIAFDEIDRLCEFFGITPDELFSRTPNKARLTKKFELVE